MVERVETRLFVEADLGEGAAVGLDPARAHFLRSVLRLKRGAALAVFNGRDGEWLARIDALGKGWASLAIEGRRRAQRPGPDLWLLFAPLKRARLDFLVEKAVELGVARLQPVLTRRTVVSRVNSERLAANAREAAEQCERLDLPEIGPPADLFASLADWPAARPLLACLERGAARPLAEVLAGMPRDRPVAFLTGPEGGFDRSELDGLHNLPFVTPIGLGPRILRADTAALAALAAWQAIAGDGSERPPARET